MLQMSHMIPVAYIQKWILEHFRLFGVGPVLHQTGWLVFHENFHLSSIHLCEEQIERIHL